MNKIVDETFGLPAVDLSVFDPRVQDTVRGSIKLVAKASVALILIFPVMLALFYGVGWNPKQNYGNIKIAVVDLDGGIVGKNLVSVTTNPAIPFNMIVLPNSSTIDEMKDRVYRGDFNGAMIANQGASERLMAALTDPSLAYIPADATSFIFDEGRSAAMVGLLRLGIMPLATSSTNQAVGKALVKTLSIASGNPLSLSSINPRALVTPVGTTEINLHPVSFNGENVAVGISFIIPWIMGLISVSSGIVAFMAWDKAGVRKDHQAAAHLAQVVTLTMALSFWPVAVLRMLGSPIAAGTAFTLWAFVWYAMLTFSSTVLLFFVAVGGGGGAGLNSLFILINFIGSPAVAPVEMMYAPMRLGVALPMQSGIEGARHILFGSYDVLPRCMGVLTAWLVLCLLAFFASARAKHRRALAEAEAAAAARAGGGEGGVAVVVVPAVGAALAEAVVVPTEGGEEVGAAAAALPPSKDVGRPSPA